jgi:broad-specificity NMP kinase
MTSSSLSIVAGAPGAGKSSALQELLALGAPVVAFDLDWLIESASTLAGRDIHFDESTWPAYTALWLDVVHGVVRNGRRVVLFAPFAPVDLPDSLPAWCGSISWLLLDCSDETRRQRLGERDWGHARIREAIEDAAELRAAIPTIVRTDDETPEATASEVRSWLSSTRRKEFDGARDEGIV